MRNVTGSRAHEKSLVLKYVVEVRSVPVKIQTNYDDAIVNFFMKLLQMLLYCLNLLCLTWFVRVIH